ncbi:integrase arm-type DNA-binding domain-containing protein [Limnohabitans sp. yimb22184]|uniref:integrase arm-type DNA-binding domain-containing protein n=1 Tax=Limnohabitans sp. YIMB22184 TaxID=3374104 RepID=UPI003A8957EA
MARPSKTAAIDYTVPHDLTHGLLERAVCADGVAFVLLRDSVKKGLRLRVTKAGGKYWQFETRVKGKLFTRALGEWPAVGLDVARKEAHRLRGLAEQGIDPRAEEAKEKAAKAQAEAEKERAAKFTFGALMTDYANELERQGKTSHAKVRGIFKLHLIEGAPKLAATPAALVTAEQVADLLRGLSEAGKERTAGKVRSYCRAAFEMARTSKLSLQVPVHFKSYGVQHNPAAETVAVKLAPDKNPLMPVHLRQYWQAIEPLQGVRGAVLRLHLLTGGQRIEQLRQLVRSNVGEGAITLLDAKGRTGRGARLHTIPLLPAAREALNTLLELNPGEYPLSVDGGESPVSAKAIADWAKDAAAGVDWLPADKPVGQFQAKRIRSGVETALASLRVSQEIRGHLLSHGVTGVQAVSYDGHDYAPQKLEALETLHRFLTETSASVVHITSRVAA